MTRPKSQRNNSSNNNCQCSTELNVMNNFKSNTKPSFFFFLLFCCFSFISTATNSSTTVVYPFLVSTMSNRRTCIESFDHCLNDGSISGDRGKMMTSGKSPSAMIDLEFKTSRCFCDVEECKKHNDCCPDIVLPDILEIINQTSVNSLPKPDLKFPMADKEDSWKCHSFLVLVSSKKKRISVYIRASCPQKWTDQKIKSLCHGENIKPTSYDYTLDIPVVSFATNITYRNVYCAICNDDTKLDGWKMQMNCPKQFPNCTFNKDFTSLWKYVPGAVRWHYIHDKTGELDVTCDIVLDKDVTDFYRKYGARRCKHGLVDRCATNHVTYNERDKRLCDTYELMVTSGITNMTYKNKYCARCNGIHESLFCPIPIDDRKEIFGVDNRTLHSYSVLVDFMGHHSKVGTTEICGIGGRARRCGYGELCDVVYSRCRAYTCGRHFHMNADGDCVSDDVDHNNPSQTILGCPKVFYYESQFVLLENSSIYINDTVTIYDINAYEKVNDSVVLVCSKVKPSSRWKFSKDQGILSLVCVGISLCCLSIHIIVHVVLPQMRNLPGKNLLCMSCTLFVAQILFGFGIGLGMSYNSRAMCVTVAVIVHFSFLATFFWMNVMAIDVCRTFAGITLSYGTKIAVPSHRNFYKYSAYAWTSPLVIVGLALINDNFHVVPEYEPQYANQLCWINNRRALLAFFVIPLAVVMSKNFVLFALTVFGISHTARNTKHARRDSSAAQSGISKERKRIALYAKLAIIMGLTWISAFVATLTQVEVLWYAFIVLNALQGVYIFFAFTFKRKVLQMLQKRFRQQTKPCVRGSKSSTSNKNTSQVTTQVLLTPLQQQT